jgi:hypothetical protein
MTAPIIHVWAPVPMTDEEYEDHPYAKALEMDKETCPTCTSPLMGGICLNACHLSTAQDRKFRFHMRDVLGERAKP